jgi:hypothetical protein
MDEDPRLPDGDVVLEWLPAEFAARLEPEDLSWRGRIVLWLWVTGYPLAMAWHLAINDDAETVTGYRALLTDLDDAALEDLLAQTVAERAKETSLTFLTIGSERAPLHRGQDAWARTRPRHVSWSTIKRSKGVHDSY